LAGGEGALGRRSPDAGEREAEGEGAFGSSRSSPRRESPREEKGKRERERGRKHRWGGRRKENVAAVVAATAAGMEEAGMEGG